MKMEQPEEECEKIRFSFTSGLLSFRLQLFLRVVGINRGRERFVNRGCGSEIVSLC